MPTLLAKYGYGTDIGDMILSESMHRNTGHGDYSEGDFGVGKNIALGTMFGAGVLSAALGGGNLKDVNQAIAQKPAAKEYQVYQDELNKLGTADSYYDEINKLTHDINIKESEAEAYGDQYKNSGFLGLFKNKAYKDSQAKAQAEADNLKTQRANKEANIDIHKNWTDSLKAKSDSITKGIDPKVFKKALDYEGDPEKEKADKMKAIAGIALGSTTAAGAGALGIGSAIERANSPLTEDEKKRRLGKGIKKARRLARRGQFSEDEDILVNLAKEKESIEADIKKCMALKTQYQNEGKTKEAEVMNRCIKSAKIKLANTNKALQSYSKKDFAEGEEVTEEQVSQEVIDNALSNDDQIRALVEKYKMLPTVEAKEQMKADMQTLGFTEDVIAMIENYAEGNFSEDEEEVKEEVKEEVCPNCGQAPCACEAEAGADVASMVAPELFDELLGPGIGESDPIDGTLPAGEILAPGTDLGHLGTLDQGIPSGEVVPEDDKEVTKIEIVNPEEDDFESIMR